MKRAALLGTIVLLLPSAGCATFPLALLSANPKPASVRQNPPVAANANPADLATEIENVIRDAQAARKAGDLAGAAKMLSQLVLVAPDDARVLGEYGKTLALEGRSDDALAFLERAIQLQPGDWTFFSAQGIAYDRKGQYEAAQTSYRSALRLKPGEPTVLNNDALSHLQAGDLDGAEKLLLEVSPSAPDYSRVAENLALVESLKAAQEVKNAAAGVAPQFQSTEVQSTHNESPAVANKPVQTPNPAAPFVALAVAKPDGANTPNVQAPAAPQRTASGPAVLASPPPVSAPAVLASPQPVIRLPIPNRRLTPIEALRADPTVMMAPIPKDDLAGTRYEPSAAPSDAPVLKRPAFTPFSAPKSVVEAVKSEPPAVMASIPKDEFASEPAQSRITQAPKAAGAPEVQPGAKKNVYVQAGSYLSESRASEAASGLDSLGARVMSGVVNGHAVFRVRIGPFLTRDQAKGAFAQAQALGRSDLIIVME